jgi:tRNA modification GTPase
VDSERAIVTAIPGTTRDIIDVDLYIHGLPVIFTDTAGLRNTHDEIELIGIKKTRERIQDANIVMFVIDIDQGVTGEDELIYNEINDQHLIIICNKNDLVCVEEPIDAHYFKKHHPQIHVSALKDPSFEKVRDLIYQQILNREDHEFDSDFVPNLRQKLLLTQCKNALVDAMRLIGESSPAEIIAIEIRSALSALEELSGGEISEDLLNRIFDKFCIGK